MRKRIAILGSTGSIGSQTLQVIEACGSAFRVIGLAAKGDDKLLDEQIKKFKPKIVSRDGSRLSQIAAHKEVDLVVVAVPGAACLQATLDAIKAGKEIALASKEVLVAAGDLIKSQIPNPKPASPAGGFETNSKFKLPKIFPIDSEHSAIWQCLKGEELKNVKRIILTASGGPFLNKNISNVTPRQALKHPRWKMGPKITIDSATLMNKGLEVIEAHYLFNLPYSKIEVIIHPQSIIHSLVEFIDGSVMAQLGATDMRLPIQYALWGGARIAAPWPQINFSKLGDLTFQKADRQKFPCLGLAYRAGKAGGTMPAALNAANEEAVSLFLENKIKFQQIPALVEFVMDKHQVIKNPVLKDILEVDSWTRNVLRERPLR